VYPEEERRGKERKKEKNITAGFLND